MHAVSIWRELVKWNSPLKVLPENLKSQITTRRVTVYPAQSQQAALIMIFANDLHMKNPTQRFREQLQVV